MARQPKDPDAPRKAAAPRLTATQNKIIKLALENYTQAIHDAPEHPLVDKQSVITDLNTLLTRFA
jgi:hypothetical protein